MVCSLWGGSPVLLAVSVPARCLTSPALTLMSVTFDLCVHWLTSCLFFLFLLSCWIAKRLPPPLPPPTFPRSFIYFLFHFSYFCCHFLFWIISATELLGLVRWFVHSSRPPLHHTFTLSPVSSFLPQLFPSHHHLLFFISPISSSLCPSSFFFPRLSFLENFSSISFPFLSLPPFLHLFPPRLPNGGASLSSVRPMTSSSAACSRFAPQFRRWLPWIQHLQTGNRKRQSRLQTPPPPGCQRLPHWFLSPLKPRPPHGKSGTLLAQACFTSSA